MSRAFKRYPSPYRASGGPGVPGQHGCVNASRKKLPAWREGQSGRPVAVALEFFALGPSRHFPEVNQVSGSCRQKAAVARKGGGLDVPVADEAARYFDSFSRTKDAIASCRRRASGISFDIRSSIARASVVAIASSNSIVRQICR